MAVNVGALQRQHPEWRIVDAITMPDGRIMAMGADGGIFALDAAGNPSGGHLGSYPGLPEGDRRGDRQFVRLEQSAGGYVLVSNRGERYDFFDPAERGRSEQPVAPPPPAAPPPNSDAELNVLRTMLRARGLEPLLDQAWGYYKGPGGGSADATYDWLTTTEQYKTRFPGKPAGWSENQYIDYEERVRQSATQYGIPADFVDQEDIGKLLSGNVSLSEAVDRMKLADQAINADSDTLAWMAQNGMTADKGTLMAWYLSTDDKGASFVDRQRQFETAQIGGAAQTAGFGAVSAAEAQRLQSLGISAQQARGAFGQVAGLHPLFEETLGEEMAGQDLGRTEQLGLVSGDAGAEEAVARRKASRQATFQGGGGAATGGLGSAGGR